MILYVGNLPFSATEVDLERWFSDCGFAVDGVRLIRDRYSGESRGFGFVDIDDDEQAHSAIRTCNREDFMGRTLVVGSFRHSLLLSRPYLLPTKALMPDSCNGGGCQRENRL